MSAFGVDSLIKHVVIVDDDVDVTDPGEVAWAMAVARSAIGVASTSAISAGSIDGA